MAYLVVRHKVEDFAKWKPIFDGHSPTRKAAGSKGGRLYRNANNPNELVIFFEWESVEKAIQFAQSPDLRQTMERAGVVDQPDVYFLEEAEQFSK